VKQFQVTLLFNAAYRIIFAEGQENVTDKGKSSQIARGPGLENRPLPAGPSVTPTTQVHPVCIPSTAGKSRRVRSIKITAEQEIDEKKKKVQITRTGEGSGKATKRIEQLTLESIKELKETFETDAADLLRELHMEHLIQQDEKDSRKSSSENR
ncbi:MAG: hypothetical protein LUO93_02370, partial [Methanomicrobiales archaeon]|nr:hypothetical protein [Methanomicrobiales archaeon]